MPYPFRRAANDDWTVKGWIEKRFALKYPEFKVRVLDGNGKRAHGRMKLSTVRASYED